MDEGCRCKGYLLFRVEQHVRSCRSILRITVFNFFGLS